MFRVAVFVSLVVCHFAVSRGQTPQDAVFPGGMWSEKSPAELGLDGEKLALARDYALTGGGSGMIVRGVSSRGTETTDTYSLNGFTRAHNAIGQACGVAP